MNNRYVWLVTIRPLRLGNNSRLPFKELVVSTHNDLQERKFVSWLKSTKFTQEWWEEYLISDIEFMGKVWHEQAKEDC